MSLVTGKSDRPAIRHGGNPYAAADLYGGDAAVYLDFSANINLLGLPAGAHRAAEQALATQAGIYPEPSYRELRQAAAQAWGVGPERIIAGNGAGELLDAACRLARWSEVVGLSPCYGEYAGAAGRAGLPYRSIAAFAPEGLAREITRLPKFALPPGSLVFVGNPNNPTGTLVSPELLARLARECAAVDGLLVVDESFLGFCPEEATYTALPLIEQGWPVLVVRSLTKLFALPGLRLGLAVAHDELAESLRALLPPWNVNVVAAAAGAAALPDVDFLTATRTCIAAWRERLQERLSAGGLLLPLPAAANFILARIGPDGWTSPVLAAALARRRVLVRDCSSFADLGTRYIRLAVRHPEEQNRLLAAITGINRKRDIDLENRKEEPLRCLQNRS